MKILAFGDSIKLPTGYGRVSMNVLAYFASKGHEVKQIGWNHNEPSEFVNLEDSIGNKATIELIPPFTSDPYKTDSVLQYVKKWNPNVVYNSNDFFTSEDIIKKKSEYDFKYINYGVVDGPDCAKAYEGIIREINIPVTPSQYGLKQLLKYNPNARYIPHGVNTGIYKPINKESMKSKFGMSGKFVFGCANRNIWRKQYPNMLNAFANLKKRGMENAVLSLICDPYDAPGSNIVHWANHLGLTVSDNIDTHADVMFHPKISSVLFPLSDVELAEAYSCWDIMLSASMAEGFGLCTIESQACGVPTIICDNSANTELVNGHGWLYPTAKSINGSEILVPPHIRDVTYWYSQPDYGAMEEIMFEAYSNQDLVKKYSLDSLMFAKEYDWSKVLPKWDLVLAEAET